MLWNYRLFTVSTNKLNNKKHGCKKPYQNLLTSVVHYKTGKGSFEHIIRGNQPWHLVQPNGADGGTNRHGWLHQMPWLPDAPIAVG